MAKIKNKKQLKWCLQQHAQNNITIKYAANQLKITPRRFRQLYTQYKTTNTIPTVGKNVGRPKKQITQETIEIIKQAYQKDHLGARYLEKIIYARQKIKISHRTIHKVLIKLRCAHHQPNKQKHRKPWIRYERKHSLSLVHTDWHHCANGAYLCTVLDDSSRKVLAAGEFEAETTKNALIVLKKACWKCSMQWYSILAVLTDHGAQFYANRRDKENNTAHAYEMFLRQRGIKHVLCRVGHPQPHGKLEKFHDLYINHRGRFGCLDEFVVWYNDRPHGALNLDIAESPNMAFVSRLWPEVWMGIAARQFGW
ncbi:MAG: DDE-type integrase/transposase/recombinase [Nitrososphaerota archaeon]|jgi:putative transposase|nr:DDE-type integrase/transposase/recombinase [Nitrososphaerota archaeon]